MIVYSMIMADSANVIVDFHRLGTQNKILDPARRPKGYYGEVITLFAGPSRLRDVCVWFSANVSIRVGGFACWGIVIAMRGNLMHQNKPQRRH